MASSILAQFDAWLAEQLLQEPQPGHPNPQETPLLPPPFAVVLQEKLQAAEVQGVVAGGREEPFTPAESACCEAARDPMACYAERFAAKEAVFKALAPSGGGASWHDVEVRPRGRRGDVFLHGTMKAQAEALGVRRVRLSLSRRHGLAMASVVLHGSFARP